MEKKDLSKIILGGVGVFTFRMIFLSFYTTYSICLLLSTLSIFFHYFSFIISFHLNLEMFDSTLSIVFTISVCLSIFIHFCISFHTLLDWRLNMILQGLLLRFSSIKKRHKKNISSCIQNENEKSFLHSSIMEQVFKLQNNQWSYQVPIYFFTIGWNFKANNSFYGK